MTEPASPPSFVEPVAPPTGPPRAAAPSRFAVRAYSASPWVRRAAMLGAVLIAAIGCALALQLASWTPALDLSLRWEDGAARVAGVHRHGPAGQAGVQAGMRLQALSAPAGGARFVLEPIDLVEDPDQLPSYADWARFFERQSALVALLRAPSVVLHLTAADGTHARQLELTPARARFLLCLPPSFWYQLAVGVACMLAAGWMLGVNPLQLSIWAGALSALGGMAFSVSAAVVGGRELAVPGDLAQALTAVQHVGALLTIVGVAGIMSFFPRLLDGGRLNRWHGAALGLLALWCWASLAQWLPSPAWGHRAMLLVAVACVLLQTARQWRASAEHARDRAVMRAMALPMVAGATGFFMLDEGLRLFGLAPPLAQAWTSGLMVFTAVGGALSLRRFRLFELDEWLIQLLLVWLTGTGVLLAYEFLGFWVRDAAYLAMAIAVLGSSLILVPLYTWFWRRAGRRRDAVTQQLTGELLTLGLAPPADRSAHWTHLLEHVFGARRIEPWADAPRTGAGVRVLDDGAGLGIPPVGEIPGLRLWQRSGGRRLFGQDDRRLAQRMHELASHIVQAQQAYARGAAEERERIADDLHDDLGAKLLTLVHRGESEEADRASLAALARESLQEMRLSVRNMKARPSHMSDVLADWRSETVDRLRTVGIEVDWDARLVGTGQLLSPRVTAQLTRVLREAISNVIRHSGASCCRVRVLMSPAEITLDIVDNGRGLDPRVAAAGTGVGLASIERRVRQLGGTHQIQCGITGCLALSVQVPVESPVSQSQPL